MMLSPIIRVVLLIGTWLVWAMALSALRKQRFEKPVRIDPEGRWGISLEMAGYFIVCSHGPGVWNSPLDVWRAVVGTLLAIISIIAFWSAVANLGRQWRLDAALNKEHQLVQTGAYKIVRHPIYASMLGMLLTDAFYVGTFPGWLIALVLFIAGTEIRVRVEDGLLRERFGDRFNAWQRSAPAYLPFVR